MSDESRPSDTRIGEGGRRRGGARPRRGASARRSLRHDAGGRCPVCDGIALLQEKWVLHIVHALLEGPKGFNAIGRQVGGCNPTTLTHRLGRLEQLGLIVKDQGNGTCRACYRLTESGERLEDVIMAIDRWADAHLASDRDRAV